jgi:hypothetical protein
VYVGGGTDFEVAFSESSSGTTSFSIANIGSNPAYSVSVIIPQQEGWTVSGSNSMIIGNLNNGDYTVASFALQSARTRTQPSQTGEQDMPDRAQQGSAPSSEIAVQVAYTDTRGERHTINKKVQLNLQSAAASTDTEATQAMMQGRRQMQQQGFFSQYKWYIIGGILSGALPALMGETGMLRGGTFVSMQSIVMALSVSVLVGVISGMIPAYKASKLKPVEALRYE